MNERDTSYTDEPVCPHCGHEERDAWEIDFGCGWEGDTETDCGSCGETYFCARHVSISYTTEVLKPKTTTEPPGGDKESER